MNSNGAASQYITPLPDFPDFVVKLFVISIMRKLIKWATREYRDRIRYMTVHSYYKQLEWMSKNDTPQKILSRHPRFLKWCSYLNSENYNQLDARDRAFIRKAFDATYRGR